MKFKSQVYTQASGSIGGLTYSHNQGGLYTRARSIPVDPASAFQLAVRNAVAQLVSRWRSSTMSVHRANWEVFAANTPVVNSFGDSVLISGQAWYIKANTARKAAGKNIVDPAPLTYGMADLTTPTIIFHSAAQTIEVAFTNTDEWATAVGGFLLVYVSRPQNIGINFFKGPYRLAGTINGAVVPPASPATITTPFALNLARPAFARFVAVTALGQISAAQRLSAIAVA